jgi:hypothetical protein
MSEVTMAEPAVQTFSEDQIGPAVVWRVYGIVPADARLPDLAAVDGAEDLTDRRLEILGHGPVAAVVEAVDPDRPARRRDLLAHSAVLNALALDGPVIPIAFGSAFAEQEQIITEFLAAPGAADTLARRLGELRGHAQFQLRVRYLMDDLLARIVASDEQISALRERTKSLSETDSYHDRVRLGELVTRAVEARQSDDADHLMDQLAPLAADSRVSSLSTSTPSTSLAFLVADSRRGEFEAAAERAAEAMQDTAVLELLGPLAAFDFVADLASER